MIRGFLARYIEFYVQSVGGLTAGCVKLLMLIILPRGFVFCCAYENTIAYVMGFPLRYIEMPG